MTIRKPKKERLNITLSHEARLQLQSIADRMGLSQSGVLEILIREKLREIEAQQKP